MKLDPDQSARAEVLARLKSSREELKLLLEPPPRGDDGLPRAPGMGSSSGAFFPRSRTMRALMSHKGIAALGASALGILVARPALALRVLRMLPAGAFARMLLARAVSSFANRK